MTQPNGAPGKYQPFNGRVLWTVYGVVVGVGMIGLLVILIFFTQWRYEPDTGFRGIPPVTMTAIPMSANVIAVQDVAAGEVIPAEALALRPVEMYRVPHNGYGSVDAVAGKVAALPVYREQVVVASMLTDAPPPDDLRATATAEAAQATPTVSGAVALNVLPTATPVNMIEVIMTNRLIPAGKTLTAADTRVALVVAAAAPLNGMGNVEDVIGSVARTDIPADTYILSNMIVAANDPNFTPPTPPPDACAFTPDAWTPFYTDVQLSAEVGSLPPLEAVVITAVEAGSYYVTLPSGYELGWIQANPSLTSGADCANLLE